MSDFITRSVLDNSDYLNPLKEMHQQTQAFQDVTQQSTEAAKKGFTDSAKGIDKFNQSMKEGVEQGQKVVKTQKEIEAELKKLTLINKNLADAQSKALSSKEFDKYQAKIEQTTQKIKLLDNALDKTGKSSDNAAKKGNGFVNMFAKAGALVAGFQIVDVFKEFVVGTTKAAIEQEKTNIAFEVFLGSASKARSMIADLDKFSMKTPFEPEPVIQAGKALLAFGLAQEDIIPSMQKIGDLSSGTGKDLNELAVIYGKAKVAGTLFAEDINQLTEAGIPVIQEFAKQLKVGEDQVKKMGSEGKITFSNLEKAFTDLTSQGGRFFGLMDKQSLSAGGKWSSFVGLFDTRSKNLFAALLPAIGALADFGSEMLDTRTKGEALADQWELQDKAVKSLKDSTLTLTSRYEELSSKTSLNKDENKELDDILQQLAKTVPTAVTEFDAYGKALGVNTEKIREFVKLNEAIAKETNREAIQALTKDIKLLADQVLGYRNTLNDFDSEGNLGAIKQVGFDAMGNPRFMRQKLEAEEILELRNQLALSLENLAGKQGRLAQLEGKDPLKAIIGTKEEVKAQIGLIEALENKLKSLGDAQKKAMSKSEITSIGVEIKKTQAELDALLGKANDDLKKFKDLLEDLEKKAAEAKMKALRQNSVDLLVAQLNMQLEEINKLEETLVKSAAAAGRKLTEEQLKQISILRMAANDEFQKKFEALEQQNADSLFELREKSDAKEIEAITRKYEKRLKEVEKGSELEKALIAAKEREIRDLSTSQGINSLNDQEAISIAQLERGLVGMDNDPARFEKVKQQAILDVQIEFAKKRLALLEASGNDENRVQIEQLRTVIANMQKERAKAGEKKPFSLDALFGFEDGTFADLEEKTGIITDSIRQVVAAEIEANAARIDSLNDYISEKSQELSQEIEMNKLGFASNVEGKRDEIAKLKKQREDALNDQRKAQKQQNTIDSATQAVSIVTASANILKGFSTIPLIGQILGIAAVATMVGAFIATKAKINSAAKMRKGGKLDGPSHEMGGIRGTGYFGDVEVEGGEFVTSKQKYEKHKEMVEAINDDDFSGIAFHNYTLQKLLKEHRIAPALETSEKLINTHTHIYNIPTLKVESTLKEMSAKLDKLQAIVDNTDKIPEKQFFQLKTGLLEVSKNGKKLIRDEE